MNILETTIPVSILRLIGDYIDQTARITHGYGSPVPFEWITEYIRDKLKESTENEKAFDSILDCVANLKYYTTNQSQYVAGKKVDYNELMSIPDMTIEELGVILPDRLYSELPVKRPIYGYIIGADPIYFTRMVMLIDIYLSYFVKDHGENRIKEIIDHDNLEIISILIKCYISMSVDYFANMREEITDMIDMIFRKITRLKVESDELCELLMICDRLCVGHNIKIMYRIGSVKHILSDAQLMKFMVRFVTCRLKNIVNDKFYESPNDAYNFAVLLDRLTGPD